MAFCAGAASPPALDLPPKGVSSMSPRVFRAAALALAAVAVLAASVSISSPAPAPAAKGGDPVAGKAIFQTKCIACHKKDGTGGFKVTGNPTPNWTLKK